MDTNANKKSSFITLKSSKKSDWATPKYFFEYLNDQFQFTLDPCCSKETAKCKKFYTPEDDGLAQSWKNEIVFMNPPYGKDIAKWMKKAYEESDRATIVCLVPSRTCSRWWHDYAMKADEIKFIKGRIRFAEKMENGKEIFPPNDCPTPLAVVIFEKKDPENAALPPLVVTQLDLKMVKEKWKEKGNV